MIGRAALALALFFAAPAHAQRSDSDRFGEAREFERAHRPADAVRVYESLVEQAPTSRLATRARQRLGYLRARSEGSYRPLATTMAFRATPASALTVDAIDTFERAAGDFPRGLVRREALALIGDAWLRVERPAQAEATFRRLQNEDEITPAETVLAQTGIARAIAAQRGPAAGATHLQERGLSDTPTHDALARTARTDRGVPIAWSVLSLFAVLAILALARSRAPFTVLRDAFTPGRSSIGLYLLLVPLALAGLYDDETVDTFTFLAALSAVVLALASIIGCALTRRTTSGAVRIGAAVIAVAAHVAVGYLAAERAGQLLSFT